MKLSVNSIKPISVTKHRRISLLCCVLIAGCFYFSHHTKVSSNNEPETEDFDIRQEFDIITQERHPICDDLFQKPSSEPPSKYEKSRKNPNFWINFTDSKLCERFKKIAGHNMWSSREEVRYPLAFSIMAFEDRQQLARLMRIIHRSQNVYCIHVDAKSTFEFRESVLEMGKCFGSNVLVVPPSKSTNVQWGYYSVLEPALTCAKMLIDQTHIKWKYLLNLNAKEFPILTNWELVRSIKALNGSNVAEAIEGSRYPAWVPNGQFDFPVRWVKGYFFAVLRRDLVLFMLTNDRAIQILEVMQREKRQVKHPDEFLFSTLVYNPDLGVPGACYEMHRSDEQDPKSAYVARYVRWAWDKGGCPSGRSRTGVCVFGVQDLHILSKRKEMFGNKFFYDFQPLALDCMEYWITKKLVMERKRNNVNPSFDEKFYSNLYCSKNHAP